MTATPREFSDCESVRGVDVAWLEYCVKSGRYVSAWTCLRYPLLSGRVYSSSSPEPTKYMVVQNVSPVQITISLEPFKIK